MLKRTEQIKQIVIAIVGTFIAALGVRLIVVSGVGADAISTFVLGVLDHVSLQFGTVSMIFNALVLVLIFFYDRKMIGIGSLINSFGLGFCLNIISELGILHTIPTGFHYPSVILGTIIFGVGTGIYLLAHAGSAAYESLMILLQRVFRISVTTARIFLDGSIFLVGFLLGGTVGWGTVIVLLLMGPSLDFTLRNLQKIKIFQTQETVGLNSF